MHPARPDLSEAYVAAYAAASGYSRDAILVVRRIKESDWDSILCRCVRVSACAAAFPFRFRPPIVSVCAPSSPIPSPQKHVWRARIVLLTADGLARTPSWRSTGKSKTSVWRWQERFMQAGVEGLLQDKTRPPGKAPIKAARVGEVVRRTLAPPPHEATHWTARAMAEVSGWRSRRSRTSGRRMASPASVAELQALDRSGLRREAHRHRRALCRSAGPCRGAERR